MCATNDKKNGNRGLNDIFLTTYGKILPLLGKITQIFLYTCHIAKLYICHQIQ